MKYPVVSRRFTEIIAERGISQSDLATRCGIGRSNISHYVSGSHCPNNVRAGQLAKVLNCNPAWLMGFDVPKEVDDFDDTAKSNLIERIRNDVDTLNMIGNYYSLTIDKQLAIKNLINMM